MPGFSAATPEAGGAVLVNVIRGNAEGDNVLDGLRGVGQFLHTLQSRLRFGKASRLPLQLLRLELKGDALECDWMARAPDAWDAGLPRQVSERTSSLQALEDALAVRECVFSSLPMVSNAVLRAYRKSVQSAALIIAGEVSRADGSVRVLSTAMRAKLMGFQFCIENGVLMPLPSEP